MTRHASGRRARLRLAAISFAAAILAAACGSKNSGNSLGGIPAPSKDVKIAGEVPKDIASKGTLTIADDPSYAPMEFVGTDNKTIEGADVDLGTAVGDVLGLKFNFVKATFSGILVGLKAGKYDIGWSSFFDTKERQKVVDMVDYFQAGSGIFTKSSNATTYTSLDQLCGQTMAAEDGTTELDDANAASKKCQSEGKRAITVLHHLTQNEVNLDVLTGRALVGLADSEVARYQVKVTGGKVRFAGEYAPPVLYAIAVPRPASAAPGSGPMAKAIKDALQKLISDGTYKKILDKWAISSGALRAPGINQATS
jgi:polar amino acid transport system substrate-binding protein